MDFTQEKELSERELRLSEMVLEANRILIPYNWHFIHPFVQVFKIESLLALKNKGQLTQEHINKFFIGEFYQLNSTVSFVDGYFKRSTFIEPYTYYIEYSLILFFQQDYAGAINLIIPSIEAILSNYLAIRKGFKMTATGRYEKIKKVIYHLSDEIANDYESGLLQYSAFNKQQKKFLVEQERKYLNNWCITVDEFLKNSLFAHSDSLSPDEDLNRHSIVHLLKASSYDTPQNYIKLFDLIKFICWLLLRVERKSMLNQIDDATFKEKWLHYEELIKKAQSLTYHKEIILSRYSLFKNYNTNKPPAAASIFKAVPLKYRWVLYIERLLDKGKFVK